MAYPQASRRLAALGPYALLIVSEWKRKVTEKGLALHDLSLGDPNESTPAVVRDALINAVGKVSSYPPSLGTTSLNRAAQAWLKRRFGVDLPSEQLVVTAGSKEAVFHLPLALEGEAGRPLRVGFPVPGYPVYENSLLLAGAEPVALQLRPENDFAFDPASDVPEGVSLDAVWVCSPHNPTGTQLSREQMKRIWDWCRQNEVLLLSDECYVDSTDPGAELPASFLEWGAETDCRGLLSFFSLSKRSGITGYRSGFVAGDRDLVAALRRYRPHAGLASPSFVQEAAAAAWADDDHVEQRGKVFAEKRKRTWKHFEALGWNFVRSQATFYVWACLPPSHRHSCARAYCEELALQTGIVATPGDCFGSSPLIKPWLRVALVPTAEELEEAFAVWACHESS